MPDPRTKTRFVTIYALLTKHSTSVGGAECDVNGLGSLSVNPITASPAVLVSSQAGTGPSARRIHDKTTSVVVDSGHLPPDLFDARWADLRTADPTIDRGADSTVLRGRV